MRGSISHANQKSPAMPNGQAMKKVVNMFRLLRNVTKCIVSLTAFCELDTGENDNKLLRNRNVVTNGDWVSTGWNARLAGFEWLAGLICGGSGSEAIEYNLY